jgi:hypothetical protein
MESTREVLIELDGRRRTSLGRIGKPEHSRYLATEYPNGDVLLRPAVIMSEEEARLMSDSALVATIENRRTPDRKTITRTY